MFNDKHINNDLGKKLTKQKFAKGFKIAILQIGNTTQKYIEYQTCTIWRM
jgi:hypothetical protein